MAECEIGDFGFVGGIWGVGGGYPPYKGGIKGGSRTEKETKTMRDCSPRESPRFARRLREFAVEEWGGFATILGLPPYEMGQRGFGILLLMTRTNLPYPSFRKRAV